MSLHYKLKTKISLSIEMLKNKLVPKNKGELHEN